MDVSQAASGYPALNSVSELRLKSVRLKFDAASDRDLRRFGLAVEKTVRQQAAGPAQDPTPNAHRLRNRSRRGLEELLRLIGAVRTSSGAVQRRERVDLLLETVASLNNDQRPRIPATVDLLEAPWLFLRQTHRPIGRGVHPATNLAPGPESDLSRLDPVTSTMWRRPDSIPAADLYHGFGRTSWLHLEDILCKYSAPKTSFGLNPGFEIDTQGLSIKVKFAEVSSEPFVTRIFDALGFHADPTDYSPGVKVQYDRRIFQEFHRRRPMQINSPNGSLSRHWSPPATTPPRSVSTPRSLSAAGTGWSWTSAWPTRSPRCVPEVWNGHSRTNRPSLGP